MKSTGGPSGASSRPLGSDKHEEGGKAFTPEDRPEAPATILAMTPSGEDVAKVIQEALKKKAVEGVWLKG